MCCRVLLCEESVLIPVAFESF
uniref:Uncharacterized protein n=1 Tax=Anguilla anguilla TaxID=7936 RepID=A0A0E9VXZ2_ANGAN